MNPSLKKLLWAFYVLFTVLPTQAIVLRHDVAKEKYLADWRDFPALAQFYIDGAHGALIAPTWVVTAAHTTFCTGPGSTILVGNQAVLVKRRYIHPNHTPGVSHDLALLELVEPVTHVKPATLYQQDDEAGQVVTFIGAGGTGTGTKGQTVSHIENQGVLRKANNRVEQPDGPLLPFVFYRGENALPLEGIGGGGDSGGPAFVKRGERYLVMGVSSRGEMGSAIGKYGNREYYTRLSYFTSWLQDVIHGSDSQREKIAMPELKYLVPGLSQDTLPQVCREIGIKAK